MRTAPRSAPRTLPRDWAEAGACGISGGEEKAVQMPCGRYQRRAETQHGTARHRNARETRQAVSTVRRADRQAGRQAGKKASRPEGKKASRPEGKKASRPEDYILLRFVAKAGAELPFFVAGEAPWRLVWFPVLFSMNIRHRAGKTAQLPRLATETGRLDCRRKCEDTLIKPGMLHQHRVEERNSYEYMHEWAWAILARFGTPF